MRDTGRLGVMGNLRAAMQAVQVGRHQDALQHVEWCAEVLRTQVRTEQASTVPPPAEESLS